MLLLIFTGCASYEHTKFVKIQIPDIPEKPIAQKYDLKIIKINKDEYYALTPDDAKILIKNWLDFKAWAELNNELLIVIKNQNEGK